MTPDNGKTVIILSVSSDIGHYLAERYLTEGYTVMGTYRSDEAIGDLVGVERCELIYCDINGNKSVDLFIKKVAESKRRWDALISCVGYPLPLGPFFECDLQEWEESVHINAIDQLKVVHKLYPFRKPDQECDVVFFAGGGANNAVTDLSAYTISKIMLTKMCELIDAENPDINAFIVGPGWTKTKIHQLIAQDPHVSEQKREETETFIKGDEGTSLDDIYQCIEWLRSQGRGASGGRNFSVVHDPWRGSKRNALEEALASDPNMYKLRRSGNAFGHESPSSIH